jgi:hypothetical protein
MTLCGDSTQERSRSPVVPREVGPHRIENSKKLEKKQQHQVSGATRGLPFLRDTELLERDKNQLVVFFFMAITADPATVDLHPARLAGHQECPFAPALGAVSFTFPGRHHSSLSETHCFIQENYTLHTREKCPEWPPWDGGPCRIPEHCRIHSPTRHPTPAA